MQVCCKSAGSGCRAWLGQAHLYSRVCRSSFWDTRVFLAWGIDVSTAICEMHSKRAGMRDGIHRVSHPTLGSWAIEGNPWIAEWWIGQTGKSWRPRAFIFLHPLVPWLLCRCWPGPRRTAHSAAHLLATSLTRWLGAQVGEGVDDGQWEVELIGERDYRLYAHLKAEEKIVSDSGIC